MSFSQLLPDPIKMLKAPFEKREGQPWLQATARNLGHGAFGEKQGNWVDHNMLGDPKPGELSPVTGSAASIQPQAKLNDGQLASLQQMIQQYMKTKGGLSQ